MLLQNPQLAFALLQAQVVMRIVDPEIALVRLGYSEVLFNLGLDGSISVVDVLLTLEHNWSDAFLFEHEVFRADIGRTCSRRERCQRVTWMFLCLFDPCCRKCFTVKPRCSH